MDSLKETVREVVAGYARDGLNCIGYLTQNDDGTVLAATYFGNSHGEHFSGVNVIVRIIKDKVIIERDKNDKIVLDALLQAGILREQIILAYSGESAP